MRILKLSFYFIFTLLFSFTFISNVCALFQDSSVIKEFSLKTESNLDGGVKLYQYNTKAYNDGYIGDESKLADYVVSWMDYGTNENIRIVNVNGGNTEKWTGATVTSLAKKYELEHPGYLVVGGINGDFFMINSTCEVMNTSVSEGEVYKPSIWGSIGTGVLGWTYDGTIVEGNPTFSQDMYLEVLNDDGSKDSEYVISSVNKGVSETGISLITNDVAKNYDLTNCKVFEVTYKIHRYNEKGNASKDRMFVKGIVSNEYTNLTSESTVNLGTVYLASKDGSLDNLDLLSKEVRLQYHLTGAWEDVVNTTGYYAKILDNNVNLYPQVGSNNYASQIDVGYANCKKNRTVIGQRSDGSTVLMTIEYDRISERYGASYYECAEYLKSIGCVNGWLLDGGGSCTMAIRKPTGSFEVIAGKSDGHERNDGNAILLVCKDPGITPKIENVTRFSANVTVQDTNSIFRDLVTIESITVNGREVPYDGNPILFDGLEENTQYIASIKYTMPNDNGTTFTGFVERSFKTKDFDYPEVSLEILGLSDSRAYISKKVLENAPCEISNMYLSVNGKDMVFNEDKILVEGLEPSRAYDTILKFDVKDLETNKLYHVEIPSLQIITKSKERPILLSFDISKHQGLKVTFSYEYIYDAPHTAYVFYLGEKIALVSLKGEITIDGVDCVSSKNEFIFTVEYEGNTFEYEYVLEKMNELPPEEKPETPVTPAPVVPVEKKKKCGKKSAELIISIISISTSLCVLIHKKD